MVSHKHYYFTTALVLYLLASQVFVQETDAAGECGKTPIQSAAISLSPCLSAAGNVMAKVPPMCCTKVNVLIKTAPKCLCAVLLSPMAKQAGIKPVIAITIPKRCNIKNRPAGKKCGQLNAGFEGESIHIWVQFTDIRELLEPTPSVSELHTSMRTNKDGV